MRRLIIRMVLFLLFTASISMCYAQGYTINYSANPYVITATPDGNGGYTYSEDPLTIKVTADDPTDWFVCVELAVPGDYYGFGDCEYYSEPSITLTFPAAAILGCGAGTYTVRISIGYFDDVGHFLTYRNMETLLVVINIATASAKLTSLTVSPQDGNAPFKITFSTDKPAGVGFALTKPDGNQFSLLPQSTTAASLTSFFAWNGLVDGSNTPIPGNYNLHATCNQSYLDFAFKVVNTSAALTGLSVSPQNGTAPFQISFSTDKPAPQIEFTLTKPDGNQFSLPPQATLDTSTSTFTWYGLVNGNSTPIPGNYNLHAICNNSTLNFPFTILSDINVISVEAIPTSLTIGGDGAGSGIVFLAKTSGVTPVTFKVRSPSGKETGIGSTDASALGSEFRAKLSWWGFGVTTATGSWTIIAEPSGTPVIASFSVKHIDAIGLGKGTWMRTKDPQAVLPAEPAPNTCSLDPWFEAIGEKEGYTGGINISDPVNIVSGNFFLQQVDMTLKSQQSITLARFYNSIESSSGFFGRGWSSPFNVRIEPATSSAVFVNSDGSRVPFTCQGASFTAPVWSDLRLSLSADTGFWTLSHPKGTQWTFDSTGKIIQMQEACCGRGAADAIIFTYNTDGTLSRVTNPAGQWMEFTLDASKRITKVTDSTGRSIQYSYSPLGNLVSAIDTIGRTTSYVYNDDGVLTSFTEPGNRTTTIAYNGVRVTSVTSPDGSTSRFDWDLDNAKLTFTDLTGVVHLYNFTQDWRLQNYSVPSANISKAFDFNGLALNNYTDALGNTSSYARNSDGLIQSITNVQGDKTSYEWHPIFHKLTKKTDVLGRVWSYTWCQRGNLLTETDPGNNVVSFRYDSHNNKTSQTDSLSRVTRWVYDNTGTHLVQIVDPQGGISSFSYDIRGNLQSSSDQLGRKTQFSHDVLDRLTKTIYPDGRFVEIVYDDAGNVKSRRDNLGRETHYGYDISNRLVSTVRPDGTNLSSQYNAAGQKVSETDALGRITRFEYSPIGLLTKTIYPDGSFETMAYDKESRLVSKTNELGQTSSLEYDAMGRLLATIDPTGARWESQFDAVGRKIADKDPLNRVTAYSFDILDRVTKVTRPDGSFVRNSFDSVGNLLSTVDALGKNWLWVYDNLNRQVKAIQPNGASSTTVFDAAGQVIAETDALNRTTRNAFDNGGRKVSTTDAIGKVWQNFYDGSGRLIAVKDPMGAVSSITYDIMDRVISQSDPLGNVNSFEFDNAGRRIAKIDAQGRRSITAYDLRDRVTSEVDPDARTVSFGYNLAGQRVSLTDGINRTWRWEFDSLGRVIRETDPLGNTTGTGYDKVGNRVSLTNARTRTTKYAVDLMNRVSKVTYPDGTLATMAYDLEGRELSRSGPTGIVTKTFDSVGNLTSETFGPWGKKWQYSFDLAGNKIQAIDPEGQIYKYRFDKLNRMVELDPPAKDDTIKFSFDAAGRLITEERPGVKTTNTFDLAGKLLQLKHERVKGKDKGVASRKYVYSPVGNRLSMTDENGEVTKYIYSNSDWLTKAVYPDGQQVSYRYNGAGDRLSETTDTPTITWIGKNARLATKTVTLNFVYDAGGRMVSRASDTFAFDADGNLIKAVENGETTNNTWSADNRLLQVSKDLQCDKHRNWRCLKCKPKTISESYAYAPESWKRITRKTGDDTYVSLYDGDDESHEYLVTPKALTKGWKFGAFCWKPQLPKLLLYREFIGGPGTDDIEVTKYHGHLLSHLKDGLGSTIAVTNRSGNIVAKIGYDAFGNMRWPDKPGHGIQPCREDDLNDYLERFENGRGFENTGFDPCWLGRHHAKVMTPYLFTGRRFDGFSQTYNNRNRQYSPKYGRFISKDPIGFRGGLNLWGYAKNNPMLWLDPSGLSGAQDSDYYAYLSQELNAESTAIGGVILSFFDAASDIAGVSLPFVVGPALGELGLVGASLEGLAAEEAVANATVQVVCRTSITAAQASRIKSIEEIAHSLLSRNTLGITDPAILQSHLQKLQNSIAGLFEHRQALYNSLSNPNIAPYAKKTLQESINLADSLIDKAQILLRGQKF
ncbi:MAG: DUF6531 domain-containing protein [Candidatus Ozemobacteraceae bacterium]